MTGSERVDSNEGSAGQIASVEGIVEKMKAMSKASGNVMFECRWVAHEEVAEYYLRFKNRNFWIFAEILGLFLAIGLCAFLMILMLIMLGY